jgi:hypothetical protein
MLILNRLIEYTHKGNRIRSPIYVLNLGIIDYRNTVIIIIPLIVFGEISKLLQSSVDQRITQLHMYLDRL